MQNRIRRHLRLVYASKTWFAHKQSELQTLKERSGFYFWYPSHLSSDADFSELKQQWITWIEVSRVFSGTGSLYHTTYWQVTSPELGFLKFHFKRKAERKCPAQTLRYTAELNWCSKLYGEVWIKFLRKLWKHQSLHLSAREESLKTCHNLSHWITFLEPAECLCKTSVCIIMLLVPNPILSLSFQHCHWTHPVSLQNPAAQWLQVGTQQSYRLVWS